MTCGSQNANIAVGGGRVQLVGAGRLTAFGNTHANARGKLDNWKSVVEIARWRNFAEVRQTFNTASPVSPWVIFNVGGNDYRVITQIKYEDQIVFIRCVQTHDEYNRTIWKR